MRTENEKEQKDSMYRIPKEKWAEIMAKIWSDEDYKEALIANPNKVLTEEGIQIPENMTVHIVEQWQPSTPSDFYFVLKNPNSQLNVEKSEVRKAASGGTKGITG